MKNIIRRPENPLKALVAFVSGLIGGLIIGKGISDHNKWMNEDCVITDETDTDEIEEDPDESGEAESEGETPLSENNDEERGKRDEFE